MWKECKLSPNTFLICDIYEETIFITVVIDYFTFGGLIGLLADTSVDKECQKISGHKTRCICPHFKGCNNHTGAK